jgi:hypothetical protein
MFRFWEYVIDDMRHDIAEQATLLNHLGVHIAAGNVQFIRPGGGGVLTITVESRTQMYAGVLRYCC